MIILLLIPQQTFAINTHNAKQLEYCNIPQWHENGFTGKGVKIVVSDRGYIYPNTKFINMDNIANSVSNFISSKDDEINKIHLQKVVQVIQLIAPDSTIYVDNLHLHNAMYTALNNDVQIITRSMSTLIGSFTNRLNEDFKLAYDSGIFMNGSSGNTNFNEYAPNPYWFSTGASRLSNGKVYKEDYSKYGEGLDFMGFTKLKVYEDADGDGKGELVGFEGTSASAPWVSGMVALYYQYYKDINGVYPTVPEIEKFIQDNCEDMRDKGYDIYTGHGLFVLPDLENMQ